MLSSCGDAKTISVNFDCSQDGVFFKCSAENLNIAISDRNATFEIGEPPQAPQEILIASSDMRFIPPEIFVKFPEIKEFIARDVSIQEIYDETFAHASKLYYLILTQNKIQTLIDFSFRNASNLQSLKLQNNQIELVSLQAFFGLTELRNLELSYNKIVNLPLHLFRDLKSLEALQLDHNYIKVISLYQFNTNQDLMNLNLENNEIVAIDSGTFDNFTKLEQLRLSRNICVDKTFVPWRVDNQTALSCCAKSYEEMKNCSGQKVAESNQVNSTTHVPLIFMLFLSILGNFFVFTYFCIYKKRNGRGMSESFELITDDVNESALEVY